MYEPAAREPAATTFNVTIVVGGPTILGGSQTVTTTAAGTYRASNIPIGTYKVSFELSGFSTKTYEDVRIQAGTTFTLDAQVSVAGVAENVTVKGGSPIIDTAATNVGFTFTKDLMNTIPNARDVWAMVTQAPGVTGSAVNVGGTQTGNQITFRGHGVDPRQNTYILNGANVTDNTNYLLPNPAQITQAMLDAATAAYQTVVDQPGGPTGLACFSPYCLKQSAA